MRCPLAPNILIPELLESVVLFVASIWMFHLYNRTHVRVLLLSASYIAFPAVGLLLQAFGAPAVHIEFSKWVVVSVDVAITYALIRLTWFEESPTSKLLAEIATRDLEIARLREVEVRAAEERVVILFPAESNSERVRQILSEVSCG